MALDKRHYLPKKSDRKYNGHFHPVYGWSTINKKEFDRIEALLEELVVDVINGKSKSDILEKCKLGMYENMEKGVTYQTATEYYKCVMNRLKLDEPESIDNARSVIFSMYLNLYNEAMESYDHLGARSTLDSMVKLLGLAKKDADTAIQINNTSDGVTINFGFSRNEDE